MSLQAPRDNLHDDIQTNLMSLYLCIPERSPTSPKGLSLISSFSSLGHPSSIYLRPMSLSPAKATDRVRISFPYSPIRLKAWSVSNPDTASRVSFLQFLTMAPNPSSIGFPVTWSGLWRPIMQSLKTVSWGQFSDMAVTATLVIRWQK